METFEHLAVHIEAAFLERETWREHALIQRLKKQAVQPIAGLSLSDKLELFRIHFLVRRALYLVRSKWREEERYELDIATIEITRKPYVAIDPSIAAERTDLAYGDLLEQYYCDISNYYNTTEAEIDLMLKGFWQRLQDPEDSKKALAILGLKAGASYKEIKTAFRYHAQKLHPDKGGDEKAFQNLANARDTLLAAKSRND